MDRLVEQILGLRNSPVSTVSVNPDLRDADDEAGAAEAGEEALEEAGELALSVGDDLEEEDDDDDDEAEADLDILLVLDQLVVADALDAAAEDQKAGDDVAIGWKTHECTWC